MSMRKASRVMERWDRYCQRYPWMDCPPGMLRAYDRGVVAQYARIRRELRLVAAGSPRPVYHVDREKVLYHMARGEI